ncbi:hypothetical protein TNCV_2987891 [Trichonephila clavipes]|nr:hypothetical protein TNCV_2987891 [Trichonephila clavipes]
MLRRLLEPQFDIMIVHLRMKKAVIMALYRSPLTVTLWPSSFLKKYGLMIPPAHKAQLNTIQPEVRFIAKQNSLMKIGNNGNLGLGLFDESGALLDDRFDECQTKLRINHLTAIKSVAILESNAN